MSNTQRGHAGTGGLQNHSLGAGYPWYILRSQRHGDAPLEYSVYNLVTGSRSQLFRTLQAAEIHLASLRVRNMMHG